MGTFNVRSVAGMARSLYPALIGFGEAGHARDMFSSFVSAVCSYNITPEFILEVFSYLITTETQLSVTNSEIPLMPRDDIDVAATMRAYWTS